MMLILAFWVLLVAAIGGIGMAALDGATRPLRLGHGALGALGLLFVLIGALIQPSALVWSAFALLAVGLGVGAVLFTRVWQHSAPPRAVVIGHGLINTLGLILLGVVVFG